MTGKGLKKSRHYEPPSSLEAEALTLTNSSLESPSWYFHCPVLIVLGKREQTFLVHSRFYLLLNLSMETALKTSTFDRVIEKALEMLIKSDDSSMGPGLQTRSLAVQELRKTLEERDIQAKQGRLGNLLIMLQRPLDNLWNKPPGIVKYCTMSYEVENRLIGNEL